jgi:glutamate-ammonia-ligase adenylyltransferase
MEKETDPEGFVAALRRAKREVTLRAGLALAAGELALDATALVLSRLAERQVQAALAFATARHVERFGAPARTAAGRPASLGVVAMGKLGGRELGFGGDLDLVFLYDEDGTTDGPRAIDHQELFTRIAQQTVRLLSQPDAEAPGYATDTRLRPSGSQGTLVVSLAAFERYHAERGAAWERQALTRARPIAGDAELARAIDAALERAAFGGPAPPAADVAALRARIQRELAGESHDRYHPKLGFGGLVDVEFLAQWLQMLERGHTSLSSASRDAGGRQGSRVPSTLPAIAALAQRGRIARPDADALTEGFSFLRAIEQTLKLMGSAQGGEVEPLLRPGSRSAEQVARRLGVRERDGHDPARVLVASYRRTAEEIRAIFERLVAPVGAPAPWSGS